MFDSACSLVSLKQNVHNFVFGMDMFCCLITLSSYLLHYGFWNCKTQARKSLYWQLCLILDFVFVFVKNVRQAGLLQEVSLYRDILTPSYYLSFYNLWIEMLIASKIAVEWEITICFDILPYI